MNRNSHEESGFPLDDDDFGAICNCAVRYALGRRTYMPEVVCGFLKNIIGKLSWRTVCCMERDIREAKNYGDACDEKVWMELLTECQKVMKEKGYESWR